MAFEKVISYRNQTCSGVSYSGTLYYEAMVFEKAIDCRRKTCSSVTYRGTLTYVIVVLSFIRKLNLWIVHLQVYPYRRDIGFVNESSKLWNLDL
jgi:hypothetical protein